MPTFVENDILSADIANKVHNFASDTFRLLLTNTAPSPSAAFTLADITATQIANGNGYTTAADGAGKAAALSISRSGQITTVSMASPSVWTATGTIPPFRYIVWWNDTPTSPLNPVIGWLDHGSAVNMVVTDTYTLPAVPLFTINN